MDTLVEQVLGEVSACVCQVPVESLDRARALVAAAPRIFVSGAGRSGLCMRAFAMRLMHLGKPVSVVGETTTSSIAAANLLIIGSGSGWTTTLLAMAQEARCHGANILLFSTDANSPIARLADHLVIIPAPSFKMNKGGQGQLSAQPLGTLFEQSLFLLCDSLILDLMQQLGVNAVQMLERHANLE